MNETLSGQPTEKPPGIGDPAIDWSLTDIEGQPASLSQFWTEKPIALIFLRHLGCTFCRQQLADLKREYARFANLGVEVICVAQGDAKVGKAYALLFDLPFPLLLSGDDLSIYKRFGLERASFGQLFNPVTIFRGIVSMLQGYKQTDVIGDGHQLGGAFIIDRTGIVRFEHRNADASDNVKIDALLNAIEKR